MSLAGALDVNLFSFLFGSILTVTESDVLVVAMLGAAGSRRSPCSTAPSPAR